MKHSNAREMVVLGGIAPYVSLDEVVVLFSNELVVRSYQYSNNRNVEFI